MKNKRGTIKNGFYKKYAKDTEEKKPLPEQNEKVIVINQNQKENLLATIFHGIGSVFRGIAYVLLFALSSIGLTAIINEQTRKILLELINFNK